MRSFQRRRSGLLDPPRPRRAQTTPAYKDGDQVRLVSRQAKDFTKRFPELVAAIKGHPAR